MKKIAGLFLVFGFVLAMPVLALHAQNSFEGTLTWATTIPMMDSTKHSMIINVKGNKIETDMDMGDQGGMVKLYMDRSAKKMYMVMTELKMGMKGDINDSMQSNVKHDSLTINPTGQKATIAGHPSEEYLINGVKGDISLWVAADFPKDIQKCSYNALSDSPGQDPNETKAIKYLTGRGLVPVRIIINDGSEVIMSMEFVKYDRKSLSNSLFIPPTDIKYNPMPSGAGKGTN